MNILLDKFTTPFHTVPFDQISNEDFLPAIKSAIEIGKQEILNIVDNPEEPSWNNTILKLERSGGLVSRISSIFYNLNSAETNDEIQKLAQEISPLLSAYSNDILLDEGLFKRVKKVYDSKDQLQLSEEGETLITKTYKSFVRNGALLDPTQKEQLREIDQELSKLTLSFGENLLAENNKFELHITDKSDLAGIPEFALEAAAMTAKQKGKDEGWTFTLDYPSFIPFMTYAENRELREKMFRAFSSKSFKGDELDNQENIKKIVELRKKRAKLLGYNSHADFILEERMALSKDNVLKFLNELLEKATPFAKQDLKELEEFAKSNGAPTPLQRWDTSYWSEKLKKEKYAVDEEMLKPYFKLENVVNGVFEVAYKLYGIKFTYEPEIPVYHEEVQAYSVHNDEGDYIGIFYADFFPRQGKRQGAWMTSYRSQGIINGKNKRPHISIVCNFTKPTESKPSLLTFNEVTTLFHEFGHALHGMLANTKYESLSGTSVFWDFVELPSQVLENWCYEKECLDLFARHYETNQPIPQELITKIKNSANFQSGLQTLRQLGFGLLDMAWHSLEDVPEDLDVDQFEKLATEATNLFPKVDGTNSSCAFAHIFQGGYSAGYYSYKWAEVLDADAFESFKENGIFDKETANAFKQHVLSAGGSTHPMTLYKRFKGREPKLEALLEREGLSK